MPDIAPPRFADLVWSGGADRQYAAATEAFWPVYRMARERLFRIGIRVEKAGDDWRVIFTPRFAPADVQQRIDGMLVEVAQVEARLADQRREAEERCARIERERAEERARYQAEHAAFVAERLPGAIADARRCLGEFGEFVVRKDRMRSIVCWADDPDATYPLGMSELTFLLEAVAETDRKSRGMFSKIAELQGDFADWPEADIVDAIESLTLADADMASIENKRGWSKADSPGGHWAYAMLQRGDAEGRGAAIKLGRALVGKYATTQLGREAA